MSKGPDEPWAFFPGKGDFSSFFCRVSHSAKVGSLQAVKVTNQTFQQYNVQYQLVLLKVRNITKTMFSNFLEESIYNWMIL